MSKQLIVNKETGQALIESLIFLPVLCISIAGIIEFARVQAIKTIFHAQCSDVASQLAAQSLLFSPESEKALEEGVQAELGQTMLPFLFMSGPKGRSSAAHLIKANVEIDSTRDAPGIFVHLHLCVPSLFSGLFQPKRTEVGPFRDCFGRFTNQSTEKSYRLHVSAFAPWHASRSIFLFGFDDQKSPNGFLADEDSDVQRLKKTLTHGDVNFSKFFSSKNKGFLSE